MAGWHWHHKVEYGGFKHTHWRHRHGPPPELEGMEKGVRITFYAWILPLLIEW